MAEPGQIEFLCERCRHQMHAPAFLRGQHMACPVCAAVQTVPGPAGAEEDSGLRLRRAAPPAPGSAVPRETAAPSRLPLILLLLTGLGFAAWFFVHPSAPRPPPETVPSPPPPASPSAALPEEELLRGLRQTLREILDGKIPLATNEQSVVLEMRTGRIVRGVFLGLTEDGGAARIRTFDGVEQVALDGLRDDARLRLDPNYRADYIDREARRRTPPAP